MGLFSKQEAYLGVDIGACGIKLVELKKNKGRAQLWTYGIADEPLDVHALLPTKKITPASVIKPVFQSSEVINTEEEHLPLDEGKIDMYATLLRDLVAKARVTTRRTIASLPVSQIFHAIVTLPIVPEKELDFHVRAKVKKLLPRPIEEMQVLHQVVSTPEQTKLTKDIKVLVTAAPTKIVNFYTTIFQRAGLELEELETEAFALERSLIGHDTAVSMVVDIGAERTNFFIMDRGVPMTYRTIRIGGNMLDQLFMERLGVQANLIRQIKHDMERIPVDALPWDDMLQSFVASITKEIQYSFDLFLRQSGNETKRPEKIILTGGAALFPPVANLITEAFPIKVFVGDPWARVVYRQDLKEILDSLGPQMAVSIGLAMRHMDKN